MYVRAGRCRGERQTEGRGMRFLCWTSCSWPASLLAKPGAVVRRLGAASGQLSRIEGRDERYSEAYNQNLLAQTPSTEHLLLAALCSNWALHTTCHFPLQASLRTSPHLKPPSSSPSSTRAHATTLLHHARHRPILILVRSKTALSFQYFRRSFQGGPDQRIPHFSKTYFNLPGGVCTLRLRLDTHYL